MAGMKGTSSLMMSTRAYSKILNKQEGGKRKMAKSITLEGYGKIMITPINTTEPEYEMVDTAGNSLSYKMIGERARTGYFNQDGIEVPRSQVCKRIEIEGQELILPKFNPTKEVSKDDISICEDPELVERALERKLYNVVTDDDRIKQLVLEKGKALEFPFVAGNGWKIYKGILTSRNGQLILVGCIGDIKAELEKYSEETVELKIDTIPKQNMKQLLKAMASLE
ncbi:hypothetical protein KY320_01565 [Candidatus Woesearchaeota archaeon]|nr:hypothetical protein [Candidatus Woesearchaeota archaeon]